MLRKLDRFLAGIEGKTPVSRLTHGSLFSGAGGFELGAHWAGVPTLWNCEIDKGLRQLLKGYFPKAQQFTDIKMMSKPPYVDIISGGFPCQDISIANSRNNGKTKGIKGNRSSLWGEMYRICEQVRPKYIIIENSPMLPKRGLEYIIQDLSKIGYCIEWQELSAKMFGFPHYRKRFFAVAYPQPSRCVHSNEVFGILSEILPKQAPRQNFVPRGFERFNARSDFNALRIDDEFPEKLGDGHRNTIESMGNAVMPIITKYIFKAIMIHEERSKK